MRGVALAILALLAPMAAHAQATGQVEPDSSRELLELQESLLVAPEAPRVFAHDIRVGALLNKIGSEYPELSEITKEAVDIVNRLESSDQNLVVSVKRDVDADKRWRYTLPTLNPVIAMSGNYALDVPISRCRIARVGGTRQCRSTLPI